MEKEIWKDIPKYIGLYQASSLGKVRSIKNGKSRELKQNMNDKGYMRVNIHVGNIQHTNFVHRLVAEAFLDKPNGCTEVNHKNGAKDDNRVENLEWVTHTQNMHHAVDSLGFKPGAHQNKPIVCVETGQVFENATRAAEYVSGNAKTRSVIKDVAKHKLGRKTYMGLHWEFL